MPSAQGHQGFKVDAELFPGVNIEIALHQIRRKGIESRDDRRMRGKGVSRPRDRQGNVETAARTLHECHDPLQDRQPAWGKRPGSNAPVLFLLQAGYYNDVLIPASTTSLESWLFDP